MFDLWRRFLEERKFWRAKKLYRQAFFLAESFDYLGAAKLLEEASAISPDDPEIWNELAYCSGKLGNAPQAESAARKAIELEPHNPIYRNSLVGIRLDECWKQTDRAGLEAITARVLVDLQAMSRMEPYPAGLLAKALYFAFAGAPEQVWRSALIEAHGTYALRGVDDAKSQAFVDEQRTKCENAAKLYALLSSGDRR
jgi:tetratricopeptide (TPR) repeat protein